MHIKILIDLRVSTTIPFLFTHSSYVMHIKILIDLTMCLVGGKNRERGDGGKKVGIEDNFNIWLDE